MRLRDALGGKSRKALESARQQLRRDPDLLPVGWKWARDKPARMITYPVVDKVKGQIWHIQVREYSRTHVEIVRAVCKAERERLEALNLDAWQVMVQSAREKSSRPLPELPPSFGIDCATARLCELAPVLETPGAG